MAADALGDFTIAAEHLPERFGLFVIIALGESLASLGSGAARAGHIDAREAAGVALAFLVATLLWWTYFRFMVDLGVRGLRERDDTSVYARDVYAYGHLPFVAGVIAFAASTRLALHEMGRPLPGTLAVLLAAGPGLYIGGFVALRVRRATADRLPFARWWPPRRTTATAACAVLAVAAGLAPGVIRPLAELTLMATVLGALVTAEQVARTRRLRREAREATLGLAGGESTLTK
jgi:low temperature requirement protein LtrA